MASNVTALRCDEDYEPYVKPAPEPEPDSESKIVATGMHTHTHVNKDTRIDVYRHGRNVVMGFICPQTFSRVEVWVNEDRAIELFLAANAAYYGPETSR